MNSRNTPNNFLPGLAFDTSYARLPERFFSMMKPVVAKKPQLLFLNDALGQELGLDVGQLDREFAARIFTGAEKPNNNGLLAMTYSGHQFGQFNPQMGDGRAALLGEVIDCNGNRRDIQLKGAGRTAFSKGGDGKAALGPVMREYIISKSMHALGIPTTRSLAVAVTGEHVYRDAVLPGAVLTRVAASHLRIGTFQFFAARGDIEGLEILADYAIDRHYPELKSTENVYLGLLEKVIEAQALLIAKWLSIGFIHGVMNTDNTTISGETIDYGPCAFMDHYDHNKVFSSIDRQGRYAFGAQPAIGQWNLSRFAEALLPLLDECEDKAVELAKAALEKYAGLFMENWTSEMAPKFGITPDKQPENDRDIIRQFLSLLQKHGADYTGSFQLLNAGLSDDGQLEKLRQVFQNDPAFDMWFDLWKTRIETANGGLPAAVDMMKRANPVYIPRNHLVEEAIEVATEKGDFSFMEKLLEAVTSPFDSKPGFQRYELPPKPEEEVHQTFCGT